MTVRERRPPLSSHPALNQIGRQRGKTIVVPLRAAILDRYIPRMKADRRLWRWMIRLWEPPPGPSGGLSATLDEAMAAFRAKWDACGTER